MVDVRIFVTYKQSVFDPQGETIKNTIHSLGHNEVTAVKVGKFFDVTLDTNGDEAASAVKEVTDQLLVNFSTETFTHQVMEET